jgi:hypothetical protein
MKGFELDVRLVVGSDRDGAAPETRAERDFGFGPGSARGRPLDHLRLYFVDRLEQPPGEYPADRGADQRREPEHPELRDILGAGEQGRTGAARRVPTNSAVSRRDVSLFMGPSRGALASS